MTPIDKDDAVETQAQDGAHPESTVAPADAVRESIANPSIRSEASAPTGVQVSSFEAF